MHGETVKFILPHFTFYSVVSPDDGRGWRPKHVVCAMHKLMLERLSAVLTG
jgi:hypothetical protein